MEITFPGQKTNSKQIVTYMVHRVVASTMEEKNEHRES